MFLQVVVLHVSLLLPDTTNFLAVVVRTYAELYGYEIIIIFISHNSVNIHNKKQKLRTLKQVVYL